MHRTSVIWCLFAFSPVLLACAPPATEGKPMKQLRATIEVPAGQTDVGTFRIRLRITNQSNQRIAILNPDMGVPSPAMNWHSSNEAYQTSLLLSYGHLSMSVSDAMGKGLAQQAMPTWATPVLLPKLELEPGGSFELEIPIGSFYQLTSGEKYGVAIEYGDQDQKVQARASVTAPR
jgi:hypothetical protein